MMRPTVSPLVNSMLAGDSIGNLIVDTLSEGTGRISILFNNNMLAESA